ncbi:MAG: hypothetical protein Q7P63_14600 [Verrucomicrobiota bacterium JB022]|nr:hypothetical protein [Verrucomicrobiota bacterium JB022]
MNQSGADISKLDDYRSLLPVGQVWFSVQEVAEILEVSPQYVRDAFEQRKLLGHRHNGRSGRGKEQRRRISIRRDSLLLYLAGSANYDFGLYRERIGELLSALPDGWLEEVPALVESLQRRREEKNAIRRGHATTSAYSGARA